MRGIPAIVLMAIAFPACAEWKAITYTDDGMVFLLDDSTIRRTGNNIRRVWGVTELLRQGKLGERSQRALLEFDCAERRMNIVQLSYHSRELGSGDTLKLIQNREGPKWTDIAPKTVMEAQLTFVCAQ